MPSPRVLCAFVLLALIVSRVAELLVSVRHERALRARGAVEFGRRHFSLFLALHTVFPLALWWEVSRGRATPFAWWPVFAVATVAAQALRVWSMRALGEYWTARILVVPGERATPGGPYRWLSDPSYTAVTLELVALPLAFGAWRTALAASLVNAVALAMRIPAERRAMHGAITRVALVPPPRSG